MFASIRNVNPMQREFRDVNSLYMGFRQYGPFFSLRVTVSKISLLVWQGQLYTYYVCQARP